MSTSRWSSRQQSENFHDRFPEAGLVRETGLAGGAATPTFGLVTALPEEFYAMRALLDNPVHARVYRDRADYVLGTLPSLDARLPHTMILTLTADVGTNAAADACGSLVAAFPSVNAVVMTGIAAGVPCSRYPERHVRLGDIVVATWGVVDYRHVVQRVQGDELRQPFPRPSALLCRADKMLEVDEYAGKRPWDESLTRPGRDDLLSFRRPAYETDVLRDPLAPERTVPHPAHRGSGHRHGLPKVHRGAIGSADVSMRSPAERDALAARYELLAFEMEGAGIGNGSFLNGLDWFMVRGISDYGDGYAITQWRRYASLAAACYVRSLFGATPPTAPRGGYPLADGPVTRVPWSLRLRGQPEQMLGGGGAYPAKLLPFALRRLLEQAPQRTAPHLHSPRLGSRQPQQAPAEGIAFHRCRQVVDVQRGAGERMRAGARTGDERVEDLGIAWRCPGQPNREPSRGGGGLSRAVEHRARGLSEGLHAKARRHRPGHVRGERLVKLTAQGTLGQRQ
jgi:nucleoside phosphorylase